MKNKYNKKHNNKRNNVKVAYFTLSITIKWFSLLLFFFLLFFFFGIQQIYTYKISTFVQLALNKNQKQRQII